MVRFFWMGILALAWCASASAEPQDIPALSGHVVDRAGVLDQDHVSTLARFLEDYERTTGVDVAVLTVKSTEPESIDQYSIRVVEQWKLGHKGVDDGVLVLLATDNPTNLRRMRIETGRGVQGVLTDAKASGILHDVMAPYVHVQDYNDAVYAGSEAIARLLHPDAFTTAEPVLALGPLSVSAPPAPVAAPDIPYTPTQTRTEYWFARIFVTLAYILLAIVCTTVILSISAIFTKSGRARFKADKYPEVALLLFAYAIVLLLGGDKDDKRRSKKRSKGSGSDSSNDSTSYSSSDSSSISDSSGSGSSSSDSGGTFDGGGASAD